LRAHRVARDSVPCLYHEPGSDGRSLWYLIRHGGVEHAVAIPECSAQWRPIRTQVKNWLKDAANVRCAYLKSEDSLGLVTAWFQKNPQLRENIIPLPNDASIPDTWTELKQSWLVAAQARRSVIS
jgi:excinuclease ABC subunit C